MNVCKVKSDLAETSEKKRKTIDNYLNYECNSLILMLQLPKLNINIRITATIKSKRESKPLTNDWFSAKSTYKTLIESFNWNNYSNNKNNK